VTYRENARDVAGEVDSLAERVKKLEEKPAKEPSKPWTNGQKATVFFIVGLLTLVMAGCIGSTSKQLEPLMWSLVAVGILCVVTAPVLAAP
jgi:hypothetical protein